MIEQLYHKYKSKPDQRDLRCLIGVLRDPVWPDQEVAKALHELDCYAGDAGATQRKIEEFKKDNGNTEISLMPDGCLVRGKPESKKQPYDMTYVSDHCDDCNKQHKWRYQRGFLQVALLGLYDTHTDESVDLRIRLVDALLDDMDASHVCQNGTCSDIFHIIRELRKINIKRAICVKRGVSHLPPSSERGILDRC